MRNPEKIKPVVDDSIIQFYNMMLQRLESLPLILVSGQARSGTTILTQAIAAHPQVLSNGRENVWLRDIMAVVGQTVRQELQIQQLAVSQLEFVHQFRAAATSVLFPPSLVPGDVSNVRALSTFSSLRREMFDSLPLFWPNFYLLNIVRNGIEVVASRLKHKHISQAGDFRAHCVAWAHSVDVIRWFSAQDDLRQRFFLVRHEQLLERDCCHEIFANIQQQFGLTQTDTCAQFVSDNRVSQNSHPESAHSPQSPAGAIARRNAWRQWTADERKIFDAVCRQSMDELGYEIPW